MANVIKIKRKAASGAPTTSDIAVKEMCWNEADRVMYIRDDNGIHPLNSGGMGVAIHGATASTARPTGYGAITWIGSVEPTNAVNNDIWINTAE